MKIRTLNKSNNDFFETCMFIEKYINRRNLNDNKETLIHNDITYNSDFLIVAFDDNNRPIGYNSLKLMKEGLLISQMSIINGCKEENIASKMIEIAINIAHKFNYDVYATTLASDTSSNELFTEYGFKLIDEHSDNVNNLLVLNQKVHANIDIVVDRAPSIFSL